MTQPAFHSAYRVGIDLGTTNCVVSYIPISEHSTSNTPALLPISQVMADGSVQEFTYLPSAIYVLASDEIGKI